MTIFLFASFVDDFLLTLSYANAISQQQSKSF